MRCILLAASLRVSAQSLISARAMHCAITAAKIPSSVSSNRSGPEIRSGYNQDLVCIWHRVVICAQAQLIIPVYPDVLKVYKALFTLRYGMIDRGLQPSCRNVSGPRCVLLTYICRRPLLTYTRSRRSSSFRTHRFRAHSERHRRPPAVSTTYPSISDTLAESQDP